MHITANDPHFSAVLKDSRGIILAEGYASVSKENRSVDFVSDFVPLYPLGTYLEIDRLYGEKPIHKFGGEVYLSDKQLLRIVSVNDKLLPGSEKIYFTDTSLLASLTEVEMSEPTKKTFGIFKKKEIEMPIQTYGVTISAISGESFEFSSNRMFEMGKKYLLSIKPPILLENIPIKVNKVYDFNENIGHLCKFDEMPENIKMKLDDFIKELNRNKNQFFIS